MKTLLSYIISGMFFIVLQSTLFPSLMKTLPHPDLLLLLVLYLGLHDKTLRGAGTAWVLGCLLDVFSGMTLGLYGMIMLLVFCSTCVSGRQLNYDSDMVMFATTFIGTLTHSLLLITMLICFADADQSWRLILQNIPAQLFTNLLTMLCMLPLIRLLRKFRKKAGNNSTAGDCAWL